MNGKFFALPQERQEQIINAAYGVFSRNSYKNASMSRLADAGGVSKSLLFHYFLNKKELYLYLWEHACRLYREKVRKGDTQTTDLFEILCQRVLAGCVFMREAPTIYLFILRAFFEENPEIREELQNHYKTAYLHGTEDIRGPADMDLEDVFNRGAEPGFSGKGLPEKSWTVEKGIPERKESLRWQFQI